MTVCLEKLEVCVHAEVRSVCARALRLLFFQGHVAPVYRTTPLMQASRNKESSLQGPALQNLRKIILLDFSYPSLSKFLQSWLNMHTFGDLSCICFLLIAASVTVKTFEELRCTLHCSRLTCFFGHF